ncbi:MAG: GntR family transcriptional regulator [Firmicutes bacterium]|nr:GntR family transcriptional regulator [Bacillota bacterium]
MVGANDNLESVFAEFGEYAAKNEFAPMRELIYQYMRDAIIKRRLPDGCHLVEDDLARNLNASRTPVREALRKLESEGLVKHHRRRGVEVRQLSVKEVSDIYDLSIVLEGYAARLLAENVTQEILDNLKRLLKNMKATLAAEDRNLEMQLHQRFHFTIYEACQNKRVEALLKTNNDYIQLFRAYTMQVPGRMEHSWEEHERLLQAIEKRDGEAAEKCAREHLGVSKEAFLRQWQENPDPES